MRRGSYLNLNNHLLKGNCSRTTYVKYANVGESSYAKIRTICIVNVQGEWGSTYENDLNRIQFSQVKKK